MLLVDDLAAGGTKNLRHTTRGLVTLYRGFLNISADEKSRRLLFPHILNCFFFLFQMARGDLLSLQIMHKPSVRCVGELETVHVSTDTAYNLTLRTELSILKIRLCN